MLKKYSNCRLDYRFKFEYLEKEKHLLGSQCKIRSMSIKGYNKDRYNDIFELNKWNVTVLRVSPIQNNLDLFEKMSQNFERSIKCLTIGFNFDTQPLNTFQAMKSGESLVKTIERLPNLQMLTVWGYPISTAIE